MTAPVNPGVVREFITTIAAQAKAALKGVEEPGFLQMSRLHPTSEKLVASRYQLDDTERMISDALAAAEAGHNVYVEGRTIREDAARGNGRGKLEDTTAVFALVIDSDDDKQMGWKPPDTISPSMIVESSPGNFHYWLFLNKAVDAKTGRQLGERIRRAIGRDGKGTDSGTGSVTQPFRVAGTPNYPGEKKIARGRSPVPVPTRIVEFNKTLWTPELIEEAFPLPTGNENSNGRGSATSSSANDNGGTTGAQSDERIIPADTMRVIREGSSADLSKQKRGLIFFNVIMVLKELGFTIDGIVALLERHPNGIALKYEGRLRREVVRAYNKIESSGDGGRDGKLERLNKGWSIVRFGSKVRVLKYEPTDLNRTVATFYTQEDFKLYHNNTRIPMGDRDIGLGTLWLIWPPRKTYQGLKFDPDQPREIDGGRFLNLWQGFGIEPRKGSWKRLRRHIYKVLANGDRKMFKYITKWTAWTLQNPDKQAEVALVFRGLKGTGKGLFGRLLREIFGQHGFQISHHDHLTGKFNKHFLDLVFLFADEAFWPGDKAGEGTLKRIITEDTLAVEPKFIDLELRRNRLHIVIASNNEWVVPASFDERRFAVSNVSDKYAVSKATEEDRKKYFDPVYKEIENGGAAAMLYDLLQMDLKGWHPRYDVPQTVALLDQKLLSLSYADQWWYELLQTATLQRPDAWNPRRAQSQGLYKAARKRNPGLRFSSDHILGKILEDNGCNHCRVRGLRGWEFPELEEARAKWDEKLPGTQWDEATEWVKDGEDDEPF